MESLVFVFVHLLCAILVFALLYWLVILVVGILPPETKPPIRNAIRAVLLILLILIAICFVLGEVGMWGTWGYGYHSGVVHRLW
jgi:heme A synthase